MVGALALVVLVTAAPEHAAAFAPTNSGRPGGLTTQKTGGDGNLTYSTTRLTSGAITANRSTATSGTQSITIKWRVWQMYMGSWSVVASPSITYTARAGQYVAFNGWHYDSIGGVFSTDIRVTWRDAAGTVLGSRFLDYIHSADYQCFSYSPTCYREYTGGQWTISVS